MHYFCLTAYQLAAGTLNLQISDASEMCSCGGGLFFPIMWKVREISCLGINSFIGWGAERMGSSKSGCIAKLIGLEDRELRLISESDCEFIFFCLMHWVV